MAEQAMSISTNFQEVHTFQKDDGSIKDRVLLLERHAWQFSLKFHSVPEHSEGTTQLSLFLAQWLAASMMWEENNTPLITRSYHMDHVGNPCLKKPRDILATFLDLWA